MQVQYLGQEDPLEEGIATHFTILAWRIAWTEKPGGLQSIESHRVRHDWSDVAAAAAYLWLTCQCGRHEMWVLSLGWEAPLEEGIATHFNILSWRIPWTEEPGGLQSMGSHRVGRDWVTWHTSFWKIKLFSGGSGVKNLPAMPEMQETLVQFLCQEYPLGKKMATHSNILFFFKHSS